MHFDQIHHDQINSFKQFDQFFIHLDQTVLFKALWSDLHFFRHLDQTSFVKVLNYHASITWKKPSTGHQSQKTRWGIVECAHIQHGLCQACWTFWNILRNSTYSVGKWKHIKVKKRGKSWGLWKTGLMINSKCLEFEREWKDLVCWWPNGTSALQRPIGAETWIIQKWKEKKYKECYK